MVRTRSVVFLVALSMTVGIVAGHLATTSTARDGDEFRRQFCLATRTAIRQDRLDFESGDAARQKAAYERFYEGGVMYHGSQSVLHCADSLAYMPLHCRLNEDYACLARIAREIEDGLSHWK